MTLFDAQVDRLIETVKRYQNSQLAGRHASKEESRALRTQRAAVIAAAGVRP